MSKFSSIDLSREEFVAWMGGDRRIVIRRPPVSAEPSDANRMITLLWDKSEANERDQPLIAIPANEFRDFFAFVGTYITTFQPYSAFFRVIPAEIVPALEEGQLPVRGALKHIASVVAGSALSEVYLRAGGRFVGARAQLPAITATLSACIGQAIAAGYPPQVLDWLAKQWSAVHGRTKSSTIGQMEAAQIVSIWRLVWSATRDGIADASQSYGRSQQAILRFLANAIRNRGVDRELLLSLASSMSLKVDLAKILTSSREERIRALNDFVFGLDPSGLEAQSDQFLGGLLLAIAGNGSFDFLRSSSELLSRSPISIIWFGICAALFEESNVLTTADCVGRRLVRDLERPQRLFDPPRADLNFYEYIMLARGPGALDHVISQSVDGLEVELLGSATTYVSIYDDNRNARMAEYVEVFAGSLQEIRSVVEGAQRRLRDVMAPRQGELFRSDGKPRGRSR